MIPTWYGGSYPGLAKASVVMEAINRSGGKSGACHGQMYTRVPSLRHGSEAQKKHQLPKIATGERRTALAVDRSDRGRDRHGHHSDHHDRGEARPPVRYVGNGQKVWFSRIQHSDW